MIEKKDPLPLISFEAPDGGMVRVRPEFLLAAVGPRPEDGAPHTRLYVISTDQKFLQLPIAGDGKNMPPPLVSFGDLSINPAFVTAIVPGLSKKGRPQATVHLHSCGDHAFQFIEPAEEIERHLRAALENPGIKP